MEFKIITTAYFYNNIVEVEKLKKLGFSFEEVDENEFSSKYFLNKEVEVKKTINSLAELIKFEREWSPIVLRKDTIEIYNDHHS